MIRIFLLAIAVSLTSFAHDGHDHSGPQALKPQNKGGIMKGNEEYFIEVVHSPTKIDLYGYSTKTDLKKPQTIDPATLKISASVELPRQKAVPVTLTPEGNHLTTNFDSKGAHRVTVLVKVEGEHGDVLKYTFEKRK